MQQTMLFEVPEAEQKGAIIVDCYRYSLWRIWDEQLSRVCFIMLNPSTADHQQDDPTLRRCKAFAKAWGYGSLEVVNLFAYRSAYPAKLMKASDPIGPKNDDHIIQAIGRASLIVAAWGTHGELHNRAFDVIMLVRYRTDEVMRCLGTTKDHHPRHPLYVSGDTVPEVYG